MKAGDVAYIASYALTKGIFRGVVDQVNTVNDVTFIRFAHSKWTSYRLGTQCFATLAEAVAEAEEMRRARVKSLKGQIDRINGLDLAAHVKDYT